MSILITGGAGYIGSHTCVEILNAGYEVVVVDNLCNSSKESLKRVEKITNKKVSFYKINLLDKEALKEVFSKETIDVVIHFAALKAVGESVNKPLEYYINNITGTLNLFEVMKNFSIKKIIYSSSATVYGSPKFVPIKENFPLKVTNPYGRTKLMTEDILRDLYIADNEWKIIILRYFNPVGAHKSGMIGEDPQGTPNNLVPYITQVAVGNLSEVNVFGDDYDTPDGSGVRDYIHVVDLADGHVKAVESLKNSLGIHTYNLGTGVGYSVFEIIKCFTKVCGKEIPYVIKSRRSGDIATCYADSSLVKNELKWIAKRSLKEMCEDAWRWQKNNPNGYND